MKTITPVSNDPVEIYDGIVQAKRKQQARILKVIRARIASAYARYHQWKPELHRLRPPKPRLQPKESKALIHCYEVPTSQCKKLFSIIRQSAAVCPYCTIVPVSTLDHYLPKEKFPEFSVLPANLVPSCSICNCPRDFKIAGERALVHPYFDSIPQVRLLSARVTVVSGTPEVEFDVDKRGCKDAFADLYERHFTLLKLKERYRRWAMSSWGLETILSPKSVSALHLSIDELRDCLEEQASLEEKDRGANDFRVALMRGIAASDDYLSYCLGSLV